MTDVGVRAKDLGQYQSRFCSLEWHICFTRTSCFWSSELNIPHSVNFLMFSPDWPGHHHSVPTFLIEINLPLHAYYDWQQPCSCVTCSGGWVCPRTPHGRRTSHGNWNHLGRQRSHLRSMSPSWGWQDLLQKLLAASELISKYIHRSCQRLVVKVNSYYKRFLLPINKQRYDRSQASNTILTTQSQESRQLQTS